jgi:hypothetical protein
MNESFVKAKSIYERMMDQSLARIGEGGSSVFRVTTRADHYYQMAER